MVTGEQIIYAREHCKDNCAECVASIFGKSCKESEERTRIWQIKRHKEFGELLKNDD